MTFSCPSCQTRHEIDTSGVYECVQCRQEFRADVEPPPIPSAIQREPDYYGKGRFICEDCGCIGEPRWFTPGSILVELALWLCFLLPGIIYSVWRMASRRQACPCGGKMIALQSPRGKSLLRDYHAA